MQSINLLKPPSAIHLLQILRMHIPISLGDFKGMKAA